MTEKCADCGWECHACHRKIENALTVRDGYFYHPDCVPADWEGEVVEW